MNLPVVERDIASPQRAAALERQSAQVVAANIANGPAALAARFEPLYRAQGWAMPEPMRSGHWRRDGTVAAGTLRLELDATRDALRPALAQHTEAMAQVQPRPALSPQERDRANLASAYAAAGVAPSPETLEAALRAVQRTREAHGLDAATTSLAPQPNARGAYDIHSPLMHLRTDSDGVVRVAAVTTAEDIARARTDAPGRHADAAALTSGHDRIPAHPADTPIRVRDPAAQPTPSPPFSDPGHPQHALYSELKRHLPDYVSEPRLAQFTAAVHAAGIKPGQLGSIDVDAERAVFASRAGWPQAVVDISTSPPPLQASLQRAQEVDHQQALQAGPHAQPHLMPPQPQPSMHH
ncbi:hypothetical protein [Luteimonas huabeiensis]|uniref:hypothetical protein n=1 Tax=Luteimonas huabeiensis TaxID=1244513 RepID=UPI00046693E0|nr:hypothetical protein [Luteimonas huabeiensis]